jgi:hypothetical protein
VHPQPQKKVARAQRIEGAIVLYRPAARNRFKAETSLRRAAPWWSMVLGVPLFLRTLLRLAFVCRHQHKSPPMTAREPIPSNLPGCAFVHRGGTYITCLDCGQKFTYNSKSRRLTDFWGVHDAEALARVRRRVDGLFSPVRGLAARVGRLNMRISSHLERSVRSLGSLTKGQWTKSRRLIASKWVPRSSVKQTQTRPGNN